MKTDKAVSEVIGAVILIGIVVIAFAFIGASLFGTPPSSIGSTPVTTASSHCVKCSDNWYEFYVVHDGGEPYQQDTLDFEVIDEGGEKHEVEPDFVYNTQPKECVGSSIEDAYAWEGLEQFTPGNVVQIFYNTDGSEESTPETLLITDDTGQVIDAFTYDIIKDITEETADNPNATGVNPSGNIKPDLEDISVVGPDEDGYCVATFYYDNTLGVRMKASPCAGQPLMVDSNGLILSGNECPKPWNEFVGVAGQGTDFAYLEKNMGQPTVFEPNEEQSRAQRSFTVRFRNQLRWRLGNTNSVIASCDPYPAIDPCANNEAYLWGYVYYDINQNGVKDSNEPGFDTAEVSLIGRYKNNPNTDPFDDLYTPLSSGYWKSRCIHMSGWAYNLSVLIPEGYTGTTVTTYPNYDEKMTGQEKHNPPRIDFGVYVAEPVGNATPAPTYTAVETPTPAPTVEAPDDTTSPTVSISSPSGGEVWKRKTSHDITWSATDNVAVTNVEIKLSRDNGQTFTEFIYDGPNIGTYSWYIPANLQNLQAKVKVIAYDDEENPGYAISSTFTIEK